MLEKFMTTGIGSMPHLDAGRACEVILDKVDIPFWPQLPKISFHESMIPQYSEGIPLINIDEDKQTIWTSTDGSDELNTFYETYTEDTEYEISDAYSKGFYAFLNRIKGRRFSLLKGHVTGPLTFTLGLKDDKGVPVYFNEEMREIALMVLKGKVRWQIKRLTAYSDKVMIFIDEPILSAIGTSSYMGVAEDEIKRLLRETVSTIKQFGGISAIHCCGKADWQLVMETGIDVVNFDAFDYFENFQIYSDALKEFIRRSGHIAWGIIPTNEAILDATLDMVKDTVSRQIDELSAKLQISDFTERIILTPSCGAGSLREEDAEKVFDLLGRLKGALLTQPLGCKE